MLVGTARKFDPAHTAVLVIDMQNDFCSPGGFVDRIGGDLTPVQRVRDHIVELVELARASGVWVAHIRSWFDEEYMNDPMRERLERMGVPPYCVSGTWGAEFIDGLEPAAGEGVITKHRYSGFYATGLALWLRGRGIQSVVLAGTATNNCVDGTGRDAFYEGFYVALVAEAACAPRPELHDHALATARHAYAEILTLSEIKDVWS